MSEEHKSLPHKKSITLRSADYKKGSGEENDKKGRRRKMDCKCWSSLNLLAKTDWIPSSFE